MQRVIRSDTAHSAHIHGYQHITIYVHSAFATNASLSILSVTKYAPTHNTKSTHVHLRATSYKHNYRSLKKTITALSRIESAQITGIVKEIVRDQANEMAGEYLLQRRRRFLSLL